MIKLNTMRFSGENYINEWGFMGGYILYIGMYVYMENRLHRQKY